jgi:hypothetical protein
VRAALERLATPVEASPAPFGSNTNTGVTPEIRATDQLLAASQSRRIL